MKKKHLEDEKKEHFDPNAVVRMPPKKNKIRRKKPRPKPQRGKVNVKTKVRHQFKTPNGQMVTTPWQMPSANDSNGGGAGVGATAIVNGVAAASALRQTLLDPWSENPMARWPDQYTMIPTFVSKDVVHQPLSIFNGGTSGAPVADGCCAAYWRGDPKATWRQASSIDSSTGSTPYEIHWNSSNADMNAAVPVGSLARPVGMGAKFTFSGVGVYHTIVCRVIELPPWFAIAAADHPTNFPNAANATPTFAMREYMRAREIVMKPGDTLNFVSLPASSLGLIFTSPSSQRDDGSYSVTGASWSGFVVWFFGLYATDTIFVDGVINHEYYLPSPVVMPTMGAANRAVVKPAPEEVVNIDSEMVDTMAYGWNVFMTTVSTVADVASRLVPFMTGPASRLEVPALSDTALCPLALSGSILHGELKFTRHQSSRDEVKVPDDFHPLPKKVEIPSSLKSSSSSAADDYEDLSKSTLLKELRKRV